MNRSRTHQSLEHKADRRVRELYRYYQPGGSSGLIPSWLRTDEDLPSSGSTRTPCTPAAGDGSSQGSSSGTARPSTAIGPDPLVLGSTNDTLTSFAQLAALRLNAERAFIVVLDRDRQYILAEATKSVNINDKTVYDHNDNLWIGSTGSRRAWSLCQVSIRNSDALIFLERPHPLKALHSID
jgi:hypothetical protein